MKSICLVRRGNLGDVLLTEPIGRHFRALYPQVYLATEYPHAHHLIGDTYTGFVDYATIGADADRYTKMIDLRYEHHRDLHYIDGFALDAGIVLQDRMPRVNTRWAPLQKGAYVLIAPDTSSWRRAQRQWAPSRFGELRARIVEELGLDVVVLNSRHSFTDMLSLIRNCRLFIGNDSGPGIIAQCFQQPALIIFGITDPAKVLFSASARAVQRPYPPCTDCLAQLYNDDVCCAQPVCLTGLEVDEVFKAVCRRLEETEEAT